MSPPPPRRRPLSSVRRTLLALLLAVVFHAGMVGLVLAANRRSASAPAPVKPRPVALRTLSPEAWNKNRGMEAPAPVQESEREREPEVIAVPKDDLLPGRVVAVVPGNQQEPPKDARFLAERNNRTDKETVSRERETHAENVMARSTSNQPATATVEVDQEEHVGTEKSGAPTSNSEVERARIRKREVPQVDRRTQIALKEPGEDGAGPAIANRKASNEIAGSSDRLELREGDDVATELPRGHEGAAPRLKLLPSASVFGDLRGAPASDLRDGEVEEGDETSLNTRENRFVGYVNTVTKAVVARWRPEHLIRRRDPTREIYGHKERMTRVAAVIDEKGRLRTVSVLKGSGVDFLDLEAVQAFERAQPFLAPPEDLLNDDRVYVYKIELIIPPTHSSGLNIIRLAPREY